MHPTLRRADRFEDLLALADDETPYVFSSIFSDAGFLARRLSKKKFKLLRRIDDRLRTMLGTGERVRFLTFGSGVSFWESYFMGAVAPLMNRRAIALTDRRIILLQIDWRDRPRELISQIRYGAIDRIKRTIIGNTLFRLKDGAKRVFTGVPKVDRKFLQNLSALVGEHVNTSRGGGMEELCPHCHAVVNGRPRQCAACGGGFKSTRNAVLLSLLFPGFGDMYLGHWKFAVFEILFAAIVWTVVLLPDPQYPMNPVSLMIMGGIVVLFMHVPDAIATFYMARKGIYPSRRPSRGSLDPGAGMEAEWERVSAA